MLITVLYSADIIDPVNRFVTAICRCQWRQCGILLEKRVSRGSQMKILLFRMYKLKHWLLLPGYHHLQQEESDVISLLTNYCNNRRLEKKVQCSLTSPQTLGWMQRNITSLLFHRNTDTETQTQTQRQGHRDTETQTELRVREASRSEPVVSRQLAQCANTELTPS